MLALVRIVRLLSVVVWVGGIVFFAFVLAPVAFHLLPSQHLAGIVVGGTLRVLDVIGLVCGCLFWAGSTLLWRRADSGRRQYQAQIYLAKIMLVATAYLHAGILPAMEVDRTAAGGDIEAAPASDPAKVHFEKLHNRSEQVEGGVLLCGLGIVVLLAGEAGSQDRIKS